MVWLAAWSVGLVPPNYRVCGYIHINSIHTRTYIEKDVNANVGRFGPNLKHGTVRVFGMKGFINNKGTNTTTQHPPSPGSG